MNRLLSVSKAARLAGVSRVDIQKRIRAGDLPTFEGKVSINDLVKVYPEIEIENTAILERLSRIQENAIHKNIPRDLPTGQLLANELDRLRVELADAHAEIKRYRELVLSLKKRLLLIQEADDCTRQQKLVLQALISWMLKKLDLKS